MSLHFTDEQKQWVEAYCNESISPEAFAQFEKALMESEEFRFLTRRYLTMDAHLYRGAEKTILMEQAWAEPTPISRPKSNKWIPWAAAAGLVFFIGTGLGGFFIGGGGNNEVADQHDDGIAVIEYSVDAEWVSSDDVSLAAGSILSPGPLQLESGHAQIEFYNGAEVILEGPVDLELISVNEVLCRTGKLRAFVPENARGFTVTSSQFELVDLGTEFGVEMGKTGEAKVQVFDGEVELYPPDGQRAPHHLTRLPGGSGISFSSTGEKAAIRSQSKDFLSFEELHQRDREVKERRFQLWKKWNSEVISDPRLLFHYDFEKDGSTLVDRSIAATHGRIIGSERSHGRWADKGALEFKRPGDRVRIEVPGEFDQLTLSAWVRMDARTGRTQALLLTDGYEPGRAHWQISPEGNLRLGMRLFSESEKMKASGYGSPVLFGPKRIGTWSFICTVYDRTAGDVSHFINGREVSRETLQSDSTIQLGAAEIGNWGMPYERTEKQYSIRNFVGKIDTVSAWKTALTADEIQEIYLKTRS